MAQSQSPPAPQSSAPNAQGAQPTAAAQAPAPQPAGSIVGTLLDQSGAAVAGAHVVLTRDDKSPSQDVTSGDDGQFTFSNIVPGPYHLAIAAAGFASQTISGTLHSGESYIVPQITLIISSADTQIHVGVTQTELAEVQMHDEEKQRVLGVIPNFYVSYVPNAAPLNAKQKFRLALRASIDPVTFGVTAASAGIEQEANLFSGYGPGAAGYGKRYGAAYADYVSATFIGGAILPSILRQDPRYFYKGTGSVKSRFLYAIGNQFFCKGDNGRWEPNYSTMIGDLAAGGISNTYYPANERGGALAIENGLINLGAGAGVNVLEEFVMRKLTRNVPHYDSPKS